MSYSLEDNEKWNKKLQQKQRSKDQGTGDFADAAQRAYQRQVRLLKPNIAVYQKEKEDRTKPLVRNPKGTIENYTARVAEEAQEIHYETHSPTHDAIDRVVQHLNHEKQIIQNRSRRREEHEDAEVNYINDANKHFNKKLKRFYDKESIEIRENRKSIYPYHLSMGEGEILTDTSLLALMVMDSRERYRFVRPRIRSSRSRYTCKASY